MPHIYRPPINLVPSRQKQKRKRQQEAKHSLTASPTQYANSNSEEAHDEHQPSIASSASTSSTSEGDEPLQPPNFPHAPLQSTNSEEPHTFGYSQRYLKHRHLAIVKTIVHKSIQTRDWARASRAFGLLLRSSLRGTRMDLRRQNHWGLGAEILLRREDETARADGEEEDEGDVEGAWFTAEGFARAKEFYERLILQYTPLARNPGAINAYTFYPIMIRLWIMHVQFEGKRRERRLSRSDTTDERREAIKKQLDQAREIAEYIRELVVAPPLDRDEEMLELQRMVDHWMGDLGVDCGITSQQTTKWKEVGDAEAKQRSQEAEQRKLDELRRGHKESKKAKRTAAGEKRRKVGEGRPEQ